MGWLAEIGRAAGRAYRATLKVEGQTLQIALSKV
jgi:hypothetical protein